MNAILLQPTDPLFFRDGRPMGGSSSGHGAAWPLPTVTDAALHAALHRAGLEGHLHGHDRNKENRARKFGSLAHAGPFPVSQGSGAWHFPRPLDLQDNSLRPALAPFLEYADQGAQARERTFPSNLPSPLRYPVASRIPPAKESPAKAWLRNDAYQDYIDGKIQVGLEENQAIDDADFSDVEFAIGIGIDPETNTQDGSRFYSAQYLRLQDGWQLGLIAKTREKRNGDPNKRQDLLANLLAEDGHILVGGQQRVCAATRQACQTPPLPLGKDGSFAALESGRCAVKWVLLSPAIFPQLSAESRASGKPHSGGWLPSWINPETGQVELLDGPGPAKALRTGEEPGKRIEAKLVAALTGRPIPVTGWALANDAAERPQGGAKPTLLAVPAGSVYYFEAETEDAAAALAAALNWHGKTDSDGAANARIVNRRSALLGEKGFGLGVCADWQPVTQKQPNA